MAGIRLVTSVLLALAAALGGTAGARADAADPILRAQLERLAQERIFFAHQSVGMNLLDGIKQLAATSRVPLRIEQIPEARNVPPDTLGHTFVAENGRPFLKLRNFARAMGSLPSGVDIAFVELCFLDFTPDTDAKAIFARYQATLAVLRAKNPDTTFVHMTAPLTTVQGGVKALAKRLLGRAPYGVLENMRREEYNSLLRRAYQGREPIFDLARVESTAPDGKAVTVEWNGRAVPELAAAYTSDGGHLNAAGKLRSAQDLVEVLASIPGRARMHFSSMQ